MLAGCLGLEGCAGTNYGESIFAGDEQLGLDWRLPGCCDSSCFLHAGGCCCFLAAQVFMNAYGSSKICCWFLPEWPWKVAPCGVQALSNLWCVLASFSKSLLTSLT